MALDKLMLRLWSRARQLFAKRPSPSMVRRVSVPAQRPKTAIARTATPTSLTKPVRALQTKELVLPEICRQFSILTGNGVVLVARDHAGNPYFEAFVHEARRLGHSVKVVKATFDEILKVQERSTRNGQTTLEGTRLQAVKLIAQARAARASDIHLMIYSRHARIQFRVDGSLYDTIEPTSAEGDMLCRAIFQGMATATDVSYNPMEFQDGQIAEAKFLPDGIEAIRLVRGPMLGGSFMVARLLYGRTYVEGEPERPTIPISEPIRPEGENRFIKLGFHPSQLEALEHMMHLPSGMNIISGPTGSGKSTTLKYQMENVMREEPDMRIITIEDPPEYRVHGAIQLPVANARSDEEKAVAFAERVRVALRMDPDVIMIGEIRGAATANAGLDAALTGHQVWATVHTIDAFSIFQRLARLGLQKEDLADAYLLTGLIAQRLAKTLCDKCKLPLLINEKLLRPDLLSVIHAESKRYGDIANVYLRGEGCTACGNKGVTGRTVIAEVIIPDQAILDVLRDQGIAAARRQYYERSDAAMDMLEHGMNKVFSGVISPADLEEVVGVVGRGPMITEAA